MRCDIFLPREVLEKFQGGYCCANCYISLSSCEECGEKHFDSFYLEHKPFCGDCFSAFPRCKICRDVKVRKEGGICQSCKKFIRVCDCCNIPLTHTGDDGRDFCSRCAPRSEPLVYNAKWLVFPIQNGDFGVEIEIVRRERYHYCFNSTILASEFPEDKVLIKKDGSLPQGGFEVVFPPLSIEHWREKNKKISKRITDSKFIRYSKFCGMHIHVDRGRFVSSLHLYKFTNLICSNDDILYRVAGRRDTTYCHKNKKIALQIREEKRGWQSSRYQRINLQNKATVEVRMFRQPRSHFEILKNLTFLDSVLDYTTNIGLKDSGDIESYDKFLRDNKKKYPEIYKFWNDGRRKIKQQLKEV